MFGVMSSIFCDVISVVFACIWNCVSGSCHSMAYLENNVKLRSKNDGTCQLALETGMWAQLGFRSKQVNKTIMISSYVVLVLGLVGTYGCFFSIPKGRTTPPKYLRKVTPLPQQAPQPAQLDLDETRLLKYAKYAKSGFTLEVEETKDRKTRIRQISTNQSESRGVAGDRGDETVMHFELRDDLAFNPYEDMQEDDANIEFIIEPATPPIESQLMPDQNGEGLSPEDQAVRKDWEGDCTKRDWDHCSKLETISRLSVHNRTSGGKVVWIDWMMNCRNTKEDHNITCLDNGWTVNRCQLICMAKCNRLLLQPNVYSKKVKHNGPCIYI